MRLIFNEISKFQIFEIKFQCKIFNKTLLYIAVEKENIEIVKSLLNYNEIDVNKKSIQKNIYF